jgi:alpha-glucosidase
MTLTEWWRDTVIYQIYPRSFADANGDGIGDLRGVIDRLDHLNDGTDDSLGIGAIWLSPFYPSPQADFGYDISDYEAVDPVYGTLRDFDELVKQAHARDIRVLVDMVMNHTSDVHPWFAQSRSDPDHPKRDWYIWADPAPDGGPPNNWLSSFEESGSAWTLDERTQQYYLHSFTPEQPDLNWRNPDARAAMRDVWRFWLDRGADGFRIDVAHRLLKDPDLRDNPEEIAHVRRQISHPRLRQFNMDHPDVHKVLHDLREVLDEYGDRLALGEVPVSDDRLVDYFGGEGMHTVFHISFWEQPWYGPSFREAVDRLVALATDDALPTYALATHDISRPASRYGHGTQLRLAAMMALTLRGIPCVYYGEEVGMADAPPSPDEALDVDDRDGQRSPMQWDETGEGFGDTPWLAFGPDQPEANVATQEDDPDSLLNLYRRLIHYRRESTALTTGDYQSVDATGNAFAYLRTCGTKRLLVVLNFADEPSSVTLFGLPATGRLELSTSTGRRRQTISLRPLQLDACEGVVVRIEEGS